MKEKSEDEYMTTKMNTIESNGRILSGQIDILMMKNIVEKFGLLIL
jgi:hypothetical protein